MGCLGSARSVTLQPANIEGWDIFFWMPWMFAMLWSFSQSSMFEMMFEMFISLPGKEIVASSSEFSDLIRCSSSKREVQAIAMGSADWNNRVEKAFCAIIIYTAGAWSTNLARRLVSWKEEWKSLTFWFSIHQRIGVMLMLGHSWGTGGVDGTARQIGRHCCRDYRRLQEVST